MADTTASDIAKLLGSRGGKRTHELHPEHGAKLAEHMNEVRAQKKIAAELGETLDTTKAVKIKKASKTTQPPKKAEAKKGSMLYEP